LLLCVLVTEIAVVAAEEAGSSAIRARGQGRTPNGKRRQVRRHIYRVFY
jgi:hydroxymethylglutaryl-CoA reductase